MLKARLAFLALTLASSTIVPDAGLACSSRVVGINSRLSNPLKQQASARTPSSPRCDATNAAQQDAVVNRTHNIIKSVRAASFPELSNVDIDVRTFRSSSNYFRTRFRISRYLTFRKMRFYIEVNPCLFALGAPEEAVPAIIAHELEHVLYLSKRRRISLLFLARLASESYTTQFERGADLRAIARGYGPGLILYRRWLYQNVDAKTLKEKQKDYLSPDEISAILTIIQSHPELMNYWLKHIPLNIEDIRSRATGSGSMKSELPDALAHSAAAMNGRWRAAAFKEDGFRRRG